MFRDKEEELQRLQAQLLEEEPEEEEFDFSEDLEDFSDEEYPEDTGVYQNFSNDYGRQLRNYASGYKAYNADKTDTDMDRFSEDVRNARTRSGFGWLLPLLVALGILGAALWLYLKGGGLP